MNFTSDNCWGAWPEMFDAVARAAQGPAASYGADEISARLTGRFSELFEREVGIFPVISGTAANALALATLVPPHGTVFCHETSHIAVDECGAPEFFTHGAKLVTLSGAGGKISPESVTAALRNFPRGSVHQTQASAISIAQSTEQGTVYSPAEIAALSALAHGARMTLHMDGARLANALASLGCSPADATWRAGVDVLSFGATKGGALGAEAVIFFDKAAAGDFEFRRKKSGHLFSKMRFVAAQLETYVEDGRWLVHAARANALARRLGEALGAIEGIEIVLRTEANAVFASMPDSTAARLRAAGASFYDWEPPSGGRTLVRLVTSFATPESDVAEFVKVAKG